MRIPPPTRETLTAAQKPVWESIAGSGRGGVGGPFLPLLTSPEACSRVERLGAFLRFDCSVPMRLRELAILVIGAHWRAEYEWFAHAPIAEKQGVPPAVIAAIGHGEAPPFDSEADRVVHDFVRAVLREGHAPDAVYAPLHALLGDKGAVELTALIGYYSLLAFQLNVFQSLPPPPFQAPWVQRPGGTP